MTFAWGNGFPMEMYLPLVREIHLDYRKVALPARAWWSNEDPRSMKSWYPMVDDYLEAIQENNFAPVVGVGHSLGSILTLIAAVKQPHLFKAVILIDPVFYPRWIVRLAGLIESMGIELPKPLEDGARKRQDWWPSIEDAYQYFRGKALFRLSSDEVVRLYTAHITKPDTTGVNLVYSKAWEAQIFHTPPLDEWRYPPKIQVPCLILAGENTMAFPNSAVRLWQRLRPDIPLVRVPKTSHLLPVEAPEIVAKLIQDFVEKRGSS